METIQVYPSARHKYTTLFHNHDLDWETINLIPHVVTIDLRYFGDLFCKTKLERSL